MIYEKCINCGKVLVEGEGPKICLYCIREEEEATKRVTESLKHEHRYTVVVEKRDTHEHDGHEVEDLYLTKVLGQGRINGWKATKVMCECGAVKEL